MADEPVDRPNVEWNDLTTEQQAGMTREYWEDELDREARVAFASTVCSRPDCDAPRWQEAGSLYCEAHARLVAASAGPQ
jgi:hypothetical protein